jgi:hypothetical protein
MVGNLFPQSDTRFVDKLCRALVATAILLTSMPPSFFGSIARATGSAVEALASMLAAPLSRSRYDPFGEVAETQVWDGSAWQALAAALPISETDYPLPGRLPGAGAEHLFHRRWTVLRPVAR